MQLVRDGLRQRGARVLAHFDFSGEHRDTAVFVDMNPRANFLRQSLVESAASRFALSALLSQDARDGNDKDNPQSERLDKITTTKRKLVCWAVEEFVPLRFDFID